MRMTEEIPLTEGRKITREQEIKELISTFASCQGTERLKKTLEQFSKKIGVVVEYTGLDFKNTLEAFDDPHGLVDDNHVILFGGPAPHDDDCFAILSFKEMCNYLEEAIHASIKFRIEGIEAGNFSDSFMLNEKEILGKLEEMKKALGVE